MTELLARPWSDRILLRRGQRVAAELPDFRDMDAVVGWL